MKPITLLFLLLVPSVALADDFCDPTKPQPQIDYPCYDGNYANGEIVSRSGKACGVDERTGSPVCPPGDFEVSFVAPTGNCEDWQIGNCFRSQAEAEANFWAAKETIANERAKNAAAAKTIEQEQAFSAALIKFLQ